MAFLILHAVDHLTRIVDVNHRLLRHRCIVAATEGIDDGTA